MLRCRPERPDGEAGSCGQMWAASSQLGCSHHGLYWQQGRFSEERATDGHEEVMSRLGSPLLKAVWAGAALRRSLFPPNHGQHRGQHACREGPWSEQQWLLARMPHGTFNAGITHSGPAWSFAAERLDLVFLDSQHRA